MAELVLAAGAMYLGYKAARKAHTAFNNAKSEMYAEQGMFNSYNPSNTYYSQSYPSGYNGSHYHSNGYGGGSSYQSGHSYGYH
jgi:hypothetical protein